MSTPRPPVTDREVSLLRNLQAGINAADAAFYFNGIVNDIGVTTPVLYYDSNGYKAQARMIDLTATSVDALDALRVSATFLNADSANGTKRTATELHGAQIGLNFDHLSAQAGIIPAISALCKTGVEAVASTLLVIHSQGRPRFPWLLEYLKLTIEVRAVYRVDDMSFPYPDEYDEDEMDSGPDWKAIQKQAAPDVFSSTGQTNLHGEREVLMTASSFAGVNEDSVEHEGMFPGNPYRKLLVESVSAKVERDLVWVTKPTNFSKASRYASYGHSADTSWVAGSLVVSIPPFGEGCRA